MVRFSVLVHTDTGIVSPSLVCAALPPFLIRRVVAERERQTALFVERVLRDNKEDNGKQRKTIMWMESRKSSSTAHTHTHKEEKI
jgi:hypothetical protein